jgi:hypothetical protein
MKREVFKGLVWPRDTALDNQGKPVHRYVVIGMLVTDEAIPEWDGVNEVVLSGSAYGLADSLSLINRGFIPIKVGTADDALMSLGSIEAHPVQLGQMVDVFRGDTRTQLEVTQIFSRDEICVSGSTERIKRTLDGEEGWALIGEFEG